MSSLLFRQCSLDLGAGHSIADLLFGSADITIIVLVPHVHLAVADSEAEASAEDLAAVQAAEVDSEAAEAEAAVAEEPADINDSCIKQLFFFAKKEGYFFS